MSDKMISSRMVFTDICRAAREAEDLSALYQAEARFHVWLGGFDGSVQKLEFVKEHFLSIVRTSTARIHYNRNKRLGYTPKTGMISKPTVKKSVLKRFIDWIQGK